MKLLRHPIIIALGLTTIILMLFIEPLTKFMEAGLAYHLAAPVSVIILPPLIIFSAVWALMTLFVFLANRYPRPGRYIRMALALIVLREIIEAIYTHFQRPVPWSANAIFILIVLLSFITISIASTRNLPIWSRGRQFFETVLSFVALSGSITLIQLVNIGWQARHLNTPRPLHQPVASATHRDRILWIVFDELSYSQLYTQRYSGVKLPEFDRLAAASTVFTNVKPAEYYTEIVFPALMAGIPIDKIRIPAAGYPLGIQNASTKQWKVFDPHQTVFQDALDAGYSTGIDGWYNPYCRLLSSVLDHCFWTNAYPLTVRGPFNSTSVADNLAHVLRQLLYPRARTLEINMEPEEEWSPAGTRLHQRDYFTLRDRGDKMLNDPSINFLMLHLPIPHPGGIYDRKTDTFPATHGTYIDNLVLCDAYLKHVREELEANGTWDSTTLVIMGDHSWRTVLPGNNGWSVHGDWTPEEQKASNGAQFDDRPGYIVKMPRQHTPARVDTRFAALRTRQLFDGMMHGSITTPDQLVAWASQGN